MNARGLFASLVALTAGCTAGLDDGDPGAGFRVEQLELAGDGQPYFVRGELGRLAAPIADLAAAPEALARVLPAIADTLRVPAADLIATSVEHDRLGMTHVRMAQQKQGLRVVGGDVVIHVGADGAVRSVNSTARDAARSSTPALGAAEAARVAVAETAGRVAAQDTELVYVISTGDGELRLAWEVLVVGADGELLMDLVYVDALTGGVVDRRPQVHTARNRLIYDNGGRKYPSFNPPPVLIGSEGSPPTDAIGLAAYDNTGATYDCYQELFQRDSYNGAGATLSSVVHATFQTPSGGTTGNNAAWVQMLGQMVYGDGDGTFMTPLARAYDVTAHELTHAVTSATAKLAYQNESGALNEGMSDILAAVCEAWRDQAISTDTWLVGEDIFTPATDGDALRYMNDPTRDKDLYDPALGGSRDFYAERYTGTSDNGGVHLNSGIPNLAFYLLAAGGRHPRAKTAFTLPGIGMEKAGAIFYRALTGGYFTANTNLAQARTATETVAQELYPGCTRGMVAAAWAAVGVGGTGAPPTAEITAPADGATVTPGFQVQIQATAAAEQCIVKVELSIDGNLVETLTAPPFVFTTPTGLGVGTHTLQVTTHDLMSQATDIATVTIEEGASVCTTNDPCADGETCQSGLCRPEGDAPGCGCAADSRRGAAGTLALMLAMAFALRRRRR